MDVWLLWKLCVVQVHVSAAVRSLVQGSPNECVCVVKRDQVQEQHSTPTVSEQKEVQESKYRYGDDIREVQESKKESKYRYGDDTRTYGVNRLMH
jgi:hypothetical protein